MSYYNRDGVEITLEEFLELFSDYSYRKVERTEYRNPKGDGEDVTISTVWIGTDHGLDDGSPIIFETMVFGGNMNGCCNRYTSEIEALMGHANIVRLVEETLHDDFGF